MITATTAVDQIFECLDLKYAGAFTDDRSAEIRANEQQVRRFVEEVVSAIGGGGLTLEVITDIRQ